MDRGGVTAVSGGTGILAGTDAAFPFPLVMFGNSVHEEPVLLVQAGLTPLTHPPPILQHKPRNE